LLTAPRSGKETREKLREAADAVRDRVSAIVAEAGRAPVENQQDQQQG